MSLCQSSKVLGKREPAYNYGFIAALLSNYNGDYDRVGLVRSESRSEANRDEEYSVLLKNRCKLGED